METPEQVVVGRARGRKFSVERLREWIGAEWGKELKEMPVVKILTRGWFMLKFNNAEAVNWVLGKTWSIGSTPVLMKRWNPLFDPSRENLTYGPVWVRLPGLPLEFWSDDIFKIIGDKLGSFVDADRSYEVSGRMTVARIMVNLDSSEGLSAELNLVYGDYSYIQILDYEGVPFRCHSCHKVGHVRRDCPLFLSRTVGRKIQREETIGRNQEKIPEGLVRKKSSLDNQQDAPQTHAHGRRQEAEDRWEACTWGWDPKEIAPSSDGMEHYCR